MLVYIEQRQKYFKKEMGRTLEGLKFSYLRLCIYVPSVKITFLVVGPWKFDVVLEKYLKTGGQCFVWTLVNETKLP